MVKRNTSHVPPEQPPVDHHAGRRHKTTNPNTKNTAAHKENRELKVQLNAHVAATQKVILNLALELEKLNPKLQDAEK
ncbi:hypothetical protein SARC_10165 [Sphaeroforma arctica JP610]|uniref:Uncharacterized protein n=1 Tax=Sphaeroforma arctica JP610 TaxID=667725 RepID=A0A0L0FMU4_9EUKA|nr:hypothetical protein SARC_10165 [Sphaeroforma arctica JP610]KNC77373.1 hypothetical protein SARC_10165 [Sphaeroforma arctica JP610]|eukprot:XP_014151275.1 hypothetical protein SARC_10165 [Sphaeroforma arctica JP610]